MTVVSQHKQFRMRLVRRRNKLRHFARAHQPRFVNEEFPGSTFYPGKKPWEQKVDIALPCATQNELDADDARRLGGMARQAGACA